jgi:hypothetical protein
MENAKNMKRLLQGEAGSVLVIAITFTLVLVTSGFAFLLYVNSATMETNRDFEVSQELLQGQYMHSQLRNDLLTGQIDIGDLINFDFGDSYEFIDDEGIVWGRAKIRWVGEEDDFYGFASNVKYYYDIIVRSNYYGGTESPFIRMRIADMKTTFANYLYLSDEELDPVNRWPIRFWQWDTLDGRVHSNGLIYTRNKAVFLAQVSTCSSRIDQIYSGGDSAFFAIPPRFNASPIHFPVTSKNLKKAAWEGGVTYYVTGEGRVPAGYYIRGVPVGFVTVVKIFGENVGVYIKPSPVDGDPWVDDTIFTNHPKAFILPAINQRDYYGGTPIYVEGLGDSGAAVWLSSNCPTGLPSSDPTYGVRQRVTVGCNGSIFLTGDLVYNGVGHALVVPTDCEYSTGLIADKWVYIQEHVKNQPGADAYNIWVHAGVVALNPSFTVHDIHDPDPWSRPPAKGRIELYGCLAHKKRAAVHRQNAGEPETGYREKDYSYDQRFTFRPPPYFPEIGSEFVVFDIEELWDISHLDF